MDKNLNRYSLITEKNKREIVLLRGTGCDWKRCKFCDYHLDFDSDNHANYMLNSAVLSNVTGVYNKLEVINSGSITDLDEGSIKLIENVCSDKNITQIHFESHWNNRNDLIKIRKLFEQISVETKFKIGIETFNYEFRENILNKGLYEHACKEIAKYFDECCLLFGLTGQTLQSMQSDIEIGLAHFERVCINIMQSNSTEIKPDEKVIEIFTNSIFPQFENDSRVDILLNNTDFGVGNIC